jgi:ribosomal protein S18 acetylase RimI-like enzyme
VTFWTNSQLQDVAIGLVSAAIAAMFARIVTAVLRYRRRMIAARSYPIDGVYASSYTDEINGALRTIRDEVRIEQHGLEFTGTSRNLETGRGFRLRGRIVEERYLAGTYGGEHRADGAQGTFFMGLDLLEAGYVQGLWAGFGAESGQILSGSWSWRKLDAVDIAEVDPEDRSLAVAASLLNDALGSGYVSPSELEELATSEDGMVLLARGARGQIVGIATAEVMSAPAKAELESKLASAGARRVHLAENKVGMLKSAAVIPTARGKGIGLSLVNDRLNRLKALECSSAVVLAWDSGGKHSSVGVLEAAGFKRVAELPEYWREPAGQETFDCVKCGRPCVCAAIVMRRSLYDLVPRNENGDRPTMLSRRFA